MIEETDGGVLCDGQFCDGKHGICPRCNYYKRPLNTIHYGQNQQRHRQPRKGTQRTR